MKIGIYGGNVRRGKPLSSLVDEVVEKEEQGFSSYWTPQVGTFDALTMLALAGQQTTRIELGTAVVPSYPRHPSALAQQAATVNALCGGRLVLGVGPSHAPGIEALGLPYDRPALHMREYVTVLKALGTEGRVDFQGETYRVRTGFACPDASPFKVVVSALAPLMLKAAGEVADGTVTWMVGKNTIANHTAPRITKAGGGRGTRVAKRHRRPARLRSRRQGAGYRPGGADLRGIRPTAELPPPTRRRRHRPSRRDRRRRQRGRGDRRASGLFRRRCHRSDRQRLPRG